VANRQRKTALHVREKGIEPHFDECSGIGFKKAFKVAKEKRGVIFIVSGLQAGSIRDSEIEGEVRKKAAKT